MDGNAFPLIASKAAITFPDTAALSMPHNAQISGVARVARLLRKQEA
jgi:hypothetical protein